MHGNLSDGRCLAEHGEGGRMCFAIMWDNGVVRPHPPVRRAMELTKKALEAAGHVGARRRRFASWRSGG